MSKKIYLFCSAGMSTSLLASKMQKVADEYKVPVIVSAFPHSQIDKIIKDENPDCILLGPQVKYLYNETVEKFKDLNKPIAVIDSRAYGLMDGEKVLKNSIKMIKANTSINK